MREPDFVDECYADKDLSLLKKLTLVIPTYNRNYYLSRCLWYHAHFPFGEIIVADSSPEEKKVVNRETIEKVREMFGANIRYLEYEPETEKYGGDIYRKWGDAVQHVETEYSQSCTDKEFLIPTTVSECISFLDHHHDYSIAEGADYQLIGSGKKVMFCPWQGSASLTDTKIIDRLRAYYMLKGGPLGTQFSVQRSVNHKHNYANLTLYHLNDLRFGETAIELQPVVFGKTKRFIELPGNCRDCLHIKTITTKGALNATAESSFTRYPILTDYPPESYNTLLANTCSCFHDLICKTNDNEGIAELDNHMSDIVLKILLIRYGNGEYRNPLLNKSPIIQYLWNNMSYPLKSLISKRLGAGLVPAPLPHSAIMDELRCVRQIISLTNISHDSDMPVHLLLENTRLKMCR